MGDRAFADIGNNFHVAMAVRRKACARFDRIIIPDAQLAVAHAIGIVIVRERKMVVGVQPVILERAKVGKASNTNHGTVSFVFVLKRICQL